VLIQFPRGGCGVAELSKGAGTANRFSSRHRVISKLRHGLTPLPNLTVICSLISCYSISAGARQRIVNALYYKPEGREFNSQ
jgi:hypothetical protein